MIKLKRGPAPEFWTRERVKKWTEAWVRKPHPGSKWEWPQHETQPINLAACEAMLTWHHEKCAFCEVPFLGQKEIEHFRSKTRYPLAAFVWRNLFLICGDCNKSKRANNHQGCLKPDRDDPGKYLWINPLTWEVVPKEGISSQEEQRARNTIDLYRLNRPELKSAYKQHLRIIGLPHDPRKLATHGYLFLGQIRQHADEKQPFSLLIRSLLDYIENI